VAEPCRDVLRGLPGYRAPLVVTPPTPYLPSHLMWMVGTELWAARVLPNGQVAWSQACPVGGTAFAEALVSLSGPLRTEDVKDRAHDAAGTGPGLLPVPGEPLLVDPRHGAHWLVRGSLAHCPTDHDGLLMFGTTTFLEPSADGDWADREPAERARITYARHTLRVAGGPDLTTRVFLPADSPGPFDLRLRDLCVHCQRRQPGDDSPGQPPAALRLLLDPRPDRHQLADEVRLDEGASLYLAAQLLARSGQPWRPYADVPHDPPQFQDNTRTIWHAGQDLTVAHDLRNDPGLLILCCPATKTLTAAAAQRLARAVVAGAELVAYHNYRAACLDTARREAVAVEARFATQVREARASAG